MLYVKEYKPSEPVDYNKLKDILSQIKIESKAEKNSEEWFEWLSWNSPEKPQEKPIILEKTNEKNSEKLAEIAKKKDYSINLMPINEENMHKIVQKNHITDKLKDLNEIKFKNSFIRRNSPKKLFQPLSTFIEDQCEKNLNFNSLQHILLPGEKVDFEPFSLEDGDISPLKLSDKVQNMGVQKCNFK